MIDLSTVFRSKARREILRIYFTNPGNRYYLRELERILQIPVSIIRRELLRLEADGIFVSKKEAKVVYYSLNKNYPLYGELKSIVFKTVGIKGALTETLKNLEGINFAFIYGSYAKSEERAYSDIDLFLVIEKDRFKEEGFLEKIKEKERQFAREINYAYYTKAELLERIKEKDSFICNLLSERKIMLIGEEGGLRRLGQRRKA